MRALILLLVLIAFIRAVPSLLSRRFKHSTSRSVHKLVLGSAQSAVESRALRVATGFSNPASSSHGTSLEGLGPDGLLGSYDGLTPLWSPHCQLPDEPVSLKRPGHSYRVDICVSTELSERGRRDAIREGYAPYARALGARVIFFAGTPQGPDPHDKYSAEDEARKHGDLVMLPMRDSYENLTLKSLAMAAYTATCGAGAYYVKADDDVFVFADRLHRFLDKLTMDTSMYKRALGVYVGTFWVDAAPIVSEGNKNHEGGWVFATSPPRNETQPKMARGEHFTTYAGGPFYILSRPAAEWLGSRARTLNWHWRNEDMAMGSMLVGADVEFVNTFLVKVLHWRWSTPPLIALHNIDDRERMFDWHLELARNYSRLDTVKEITANGG
jgi:hypothetical protein